MFKVGDLVWATRNEYNVTSYHRPCTVVSIDTNYIRVKPFHCNDTFKVNPKFFELADSKRIFAPGELVYNENIEEQVKFYKYTSWGDILYKTLDDRVLRCGIDIIRKVNGLYVY